MKTTQDTTNTTTFKSYRTTTGTYSNEFKMPEGGCMYYKHYITKKYWFPKFLIHSFEPTCHILECTSNADIASFITSFASAKKGFKYKKLLITYTGGILYFIDKKNGYGYSIKTNDIFKSLKSIMKKAANLQPKHTYSRDWFKSYAKQCEFIYA
jgi:hypothetical protein